MSHVALEKITALSLEIYEIGFSAGVNSILNAQKENISEGVVLTKDVFEKLYKFLDEDLATLPCESRQRELPEEMWEYAMYLRDTLDRAIKPEAK